MNQHWSVQHRLEDDNILLRRSKLSKRRILLRNDRLILLDKTFKESIFASIYWIHFILIPVNLSRCLHCSLSEKNLKRIDFRIDRSNFFSIISQFNSLPCYLQPEPHYLCNFSLNQDPFLYSLNSVRWRAKPSSSILSGTKLLSSVRATKTSTFRKESASGRKRISRIQACESNFRKISRNDSKKTLNQMY